MPDLAPILNSKGFMAAVSALAGFLLRNLVELSRGRVRVLDYSVGHERVGISTQDNVFGNIEVTWEGHPIATLFLSTVTLENNTTSNYKDLTFKVWTGDATTLLNERREARDTTSQPTTYLPEHSARFMDRIRVAPGDAPTQAQKDFYWHNREYTLAVFNRGQRIVLSYLTSIPAGQPPTPWVWLDTQHAGVEAKFRPNVPRIHGIPVSTALPVGLAASVLIFVLASWGGSAHTWAASAVALFVGFIVQSIGAALFRVGRLLYRLVFH